MLKRKARSPICPGTYNGWRRRFSLKDKRILIANPRNVEFKHESRTEVRMTYKPESDAAVANRISRILIDNNLIDNAKVRQVLPNYDALVQSLAKYTSSYTEEVTGVSDAVLIQAAERLGRNADRFILIGNDILDTGQGEAILSALLNLSLLLQYGGEGSVNIYPPREHCNSQGVNDMGMVPETLPGYQPSNLNQQNMVADLWKNCSQGAIKMLFIAGVVVASK